MTKSYKEITGDISVYLSKMHKEIPDVMSSLGALSKSVSKNGVLDKKTKELIAMSLGVAARCDGCIGFHTKTLCELGTTREELLEALSMAIYMGGGPSTVYAAYALKAFEEFSNQ
ncbi:hypothetical protein I862_01165 [endosymbiont of Acanthamoeba sp. UWC8]|uniref:carboxymuconolactone decarboxylase family protein n=1 Tax=endosymbiont of Acanthamoeba sp. UWC8 TaxID=86106 RepID=UPI0004D1B89E|nr:carboxymuconolactone decarboxylase family protein [endosymbiont of Acanthamoeba sp. UWC8]AIF80796.1 hypothetical protein I862_01165 [endosymbiont of Acanthamoeba sp. UWC8]